MLKIRVLTAALLSGFLLTALFVLPTRYTVLIYGLICAAGAWEWSGFGALRSTVARAIYTLAVGALLVAALWLSAGTDFLYLLLAGACLWWVVALFWIGFAPQRQAPWMTLFCGVLVLVPAFAALARLQVSSGRDSVHGAELVLWLMLLVSAADIGAYFAGVRYGRRKLAPRVSPGKTWEGVFGGLAAVAFVSLLGALRLRLPVLITVSLGCAVGVFSIIGDLTESMFKRAAGLKDSGMILPGHGGILDRIDSIVAAAPLYALGLLGSGAIG